MRGDRIFSVDLSESTEESFYATISTSYPKRVQRRIQPDQPFLQEERDQLEKKENKFS